MKKILFVNAGSDPKDRTGWSGTPFSIYHELIKYFDVDTYVTYYKESKIKSFFKRGMHKLFHTGFLEYHSTRFAKRSSHEVQKVLQDRKYDAVFSLGVANIAFLETNCPIIYLSDAVVADMIDYYWFHINKKSLQEANDTQKRAMENAAVNVFSSEWAKLGAMNSYGIAEEKSKVVRAECSALIFCEASAYSLPIITYDTGGVGDYVINGKNGYRLPLEASGKDFANKIIDILHDEAELAKMQKCARTMYEQEYNWVVFGNRIREIIERIS